MPEGSLLGLSEPILALHANDHYFCGLDQGGGFVADFQAHFADGVRRDDRRDPLAADGECYLGDQAVNF